MSCSLKERSSQGLRAVRTEVEERERVQEQLEGVREWLESAVSLLAVLENEPSKKQLQVCFLSCDVHLLSWSLSTLHVFLTWVKQLDSNFAQARFVTVSKSIAPAWELIKLMRCRWREEGFAIDTMFCLSLTAASKLHYLCPHSAWYTVWIIPLTHE